MRLFVAVDVDRATREAASRLRASLLRERPAAERALRWVDPKHLHMTLKFLGERDDVTEVQRVLSSGWQQPAFTVEWGSPDWLPPHGRPRVLHVPATQGREAMGALAAETGTRLRELGVDPETRPFTAHLTLARVREAAEANLLRQVAGSLREPFAPGVRVEVRSVILYESRLSPAGPTYRAVARGTLT